MPGHQGDRVGVPCHPGARVPILGTEHHTSSPLRWDHFTQSNRLWWITGAGDLFDPHSFFFLVTKEKGDFFENFKVSLLFFLSLPFFLDLLPGGQGCCLKVNISGQMLYVSVVHSPEKCLLLHSIVTILSHDKKITSKPIRLVLQGLCSGKHDNLVTNDNDSMTRFSSSRLLCFITSSKKLNVS